LLGIVLLESRTVAHSAAFGLLMRSRWETLGELLAQLTTLPPEERAPYMQSVCGEDEGLRTELVSLLRAHSAWGPLDLAPEFINLDAEPVESVDLPGALVGPVSPASAHW
jgi:hypothetical protein